MSILACFDNLRGSQFGRKRRGAIETPIALQDACHYGVVALLWMEKQRRSKRQQAGVASTRYNETEGTDWVRRNERRQWTDRLGNRPRPRVDRVIALVVEVQP